MSSRSRRIPDKITAALPERVLTATRLESGGWLALTRSELARFDGDVLAWRRPWHEVERGEWDGETHTLTVRWVGLPDPDPFVTADESPRDLPLTFRERVDASVVYRKSESAAGGGTLHAVVRRAPDGSLLTQVLATGRVLPGPALDAQIDALDASVRDAVGM